MVKRLHIVLDDKTFEEIRGIKDELKVTWDQFLILASHVLKEQPEDKLREMKNKLFG